MPFPLAAIPIVTGVAQTLAGIFTKKGKRPQYKVPGAARETLSFARRNAMATTRPGNQQALDQINRNSGSGMSLLRRSAGSGSQLVAGAVGINANANQATAQNNAQNDVFRFNAQQNLQSTLQNFAQYQDRAFFENEMKPYQDRANTKASLIGAGIQNAVAGAVDLQANKTEQGFLDYMMGNTDSKDAFSMFKGRRSKIGGNQFGFGGIPSIGPV